MKNSLVMLSLSCLGFALTACTPPSSSYLKTAQNVYVQQNYGVTFNSLQSAASGGNAAAQYALGYLYFYGMGTQSNPVQAMEWFHKAAKQGYAPAIKAINLVQRQQPNPVTDQAPATTTSNSNAPDIHLGPIVSNPTKPAKQALPKPKINPNNLVSSYNFVKVPKAATTSSSNTTTTQPTNMQGNLTLRLYANYDKQKALQFMAENNLATTANIKVSQVNGRTLYTVIYGRYSTNSQAQAAIKQLPANLQATNPWIQKIN